MNRKMKKHHLYHTLTASLLLMAVFGLAACSTDDNPVNNVNAPGNTTWQEPDYDAVKCNVPVFVSYSIKSEVRTALESYLTNITSLDEAQVAVVESEDIGTYEGKLLNLYNRGGLVVVAHPTADGFADFADKYDIPNYMPTESSQPLLLFATDNNNHHYALYADGPFDGNYTDDVETYVPEEPISEDITEPQLESEDTYYKRRIFEFFRWIKQDRNVARTRAAAQWGATYQPIITDPSSVRLTHNFEIKMNHEVYHMWGCSKDYLNVTGSIDVVYNIYNAYVFGGNSNSGDYYFVTRNVTVHNGDSYRPYNKWHGGIKEWVTGYYMEGLELISKLKDVRGGGKESDLKDTQFAVEPTPGSTIGASSYTSGYSLNLTGSLTAGTQKGMSMGFGASYSSSHTKDISDLEIQKLTNSENCEVKYDYTIKNILTSNVTLTTNDGNKKLTADVPPIARSDFDAVSDWCWLVPAGTNDVGENKNTQFKMYTHFEFRYGCQVRIIGTWGTVFDKNRHYSNTAACYQSVTMPNRQPFGIMDVQNVHDHKIGNMKIWKQGEQDSPSKVFFELGHSIKAGDSEDIALPVGTYYVEYCQMDGDNNILSTWKIENVKLHSGNTRDDAATTASTEKAQKL